MEGNNSKLNNKKDTKTKDKLVKMIYIFIIIVLTFVDTAPLIGYAIEMEESKEDINNVELGEETFGEGLTEDVSNEVGEIEIKQEDLEIEEDDENGQGLKSDDIEEVETDNKELATLEEVDETEETDLEEGDSQASFEDIEQDKGISRFSLYSAPTYVMATDSDFSGTTNGSFRYIGNDDYVEIPHTIKGVNVTSYTNMFREGNVKGVKSTNKNVDTMASMFLDYNGSSLELSQLDTSGVTNMSQMFYNNVVSSYNLRTITGLETWDTSRVTTMGSMFFGVRVSSLDLSNFDTSNVNNFVNTFRDMPHIVELDLSSFETSNVTSMGLMFYSNRASRIIWDNDKWDTSNVTNMQEMFYATTGVNGLGLSEFNTSKVTNMARMFYSSGAKELDLRSFDTSNVVLMSNMFQNSKATTILGLETFNTAKVTDMTAMFQHSQATRLDLRSFNTSKIKNMVSMFDGSMATELLLGKGFDTTNVTNMSFMFRSTSAKNLDLSNFNTSRVITMHRMFTSAEAVELDLRSFDTQRVTDMERMFENAKATTIRLTSFDTSYVTTMKQMFNNSHAKELDLSSFDTRSVNDTSGMFANTKLGKALSKSQYDADKLNSSMGTTTIMFKPKYELAEDEDFIGTINGSFKYVGNEDYIEVPHTIRGVNATSYRGMFEGTSIKGVISTNTNVTDMANMFKDTTSTDIDVSTITTDNVLNMSGMFENSKVTNLDLRKFVTDNVTNMSNMFRNTKVNEIDLGSFNMGKVTNTNNMFQNTTATIGYARTEEDELKINKSSNKPSSLKVTVWGITVTALTSGWTNEEVTLKVESRSGNTKIKETELVNNAGENILGGIFNPKLTNGYGGVSFKRTDNISVPEWGVNDANRFTVRGGDHTIKFLWGVNPTTPWLGQQATYSVNVKNEGKYPFIVHHNGITGIANRTIQPGFSGRITGTGTFRTSHSFIQVHVRSNYDEVDAVFWGHKIELGGTATEYTPPLPTTVDEGVFPVYNNGTYIFRSTDTNGETRIHSHTVANIDRTNPEIEVTPSTTGWTSQDVTLYVNAKDSISGVKSVTLPDGRVVTTDTGEYVVKTNGDYTFEVVDNAGNKTTETVKVNNIDRSVPSITARPNTEEWTNEPVTITVISEGSASGIKEMKMTSHNIKGMSPLPNGDFSKGSEGWNTRGNVVFSNNTVKINKGVEGNVNDIYKNINVGTGDKVSLTIRARGKGVMGVRFGMDVKNSERINLTSDYKEHTVVVERKEFANQSLIFESLDGSELEIDNIDVNNVLDYTVTENGLYALKSTYNNGETSEASVNVTNIDTKAPMVTVKNNPEDWTEEDEVELDIQVTDNGQSGVKSVTMPDGKETTNTTFKYKVTKNGIYEFIVEDNIGNKKTHSITVDKLMILYSFYVYDTNGKPIEDAGFELLRDGIVHARALSNVNGLVDFGKVPTEGVYSIRQIKAPEGGIVNPEEIPLPDLEEPLEVTSYSRGTEMPATGTTSTITLLATIITTLGITYYIDKKKKKVSE